MRPTNRLTAGGDGLKSFRGRADTHGVNRPLSLEQLQERVDRLRAAVEGLASLGRTPQQRLDRALSAFLRAYPGDAPDGVQGEQFRALFAALGDPPFGTTISMPIETLKPEELEAIAAAMLSCYDDACRVLADATPRT